MAKTKQILFFLWCFVLPIVLMIRTILYGYPSDRTSVIIVLITFAMLIDVAKPLIEKENHNG